MMMPLTTLRTTPSFLLSFSLHLTQSRISLSTRYSIQSRISLSTRYPLSSLNCPTRKNDIHPPFPTSPKHPSTKHFCTATSASAPIDEKREGEIDMVKIKEAANALDIRVGRILKAWRHEEADSLYVEEVDVGEAEPRVICSGLVKYVPLEHLQDRNVVVLANLKPRNMRGVKSNGMLMAASDDSHENVELLVPPEGSVPGDRIWFGRVDEKETLPDVASPNQIQKKKIWELVQPHLRTDDSGIASLGTETMVTASGAVSSITLKNARIS